MILQLDPDDDEAEEDERDEVEEAGRRRIASALGSTQAELNDLLASGRLVPAELQRLLTRYQNNFTEVLAEALRRANRDARSAELQAAHRYAIQRTVDEGAAAGIDVALRQLGNVGLNLSYGPVNRFAVAWAQQYGYELITRIDESTGRQVAHAVSGWIERGERLEMLIRQLEPTFGRVRAEMIASTETTRAFTEGTLIGYRQSGVVIATEWRTAQDERVCPICRPLHGTRGNMNAEALHPGGEAAAARYAGQSFRPPAHVRCRCIVAPIVDEVALTAAKLTGAPAPVAPTVAPAPAATPETLPRVVIPRTPPTERAIDMAEPWQEPTA